MGVQVNIASILPALREMSEGELRDQLEMVAQTSNLFEEASGPSFTNGKGHRIESNFRPPTGFGGIGEGGSFNRPGSPVLDDMYVWPYIIAMPFELTGSTIANFNDPKSAIKGLGGYIAKVTEAYNKEKNFQAFNDGSGQRAIYKSGTTTMLCYNAIDHTPLSGFGSTKGAVQLRVGEYYDVYDATLATYRGTCQITSKTNKSAVVASAVTGITDTDVLVLQNSLNKLPKGLPYIVNNDTGLFQQLSRSTYTELKAPVTDLNGAAVSVAAFSKTKGLLRIRAGAGKVKTVVAIMSEAQADALTRLGQNLKRWDGDAKTFDGSFQDFKHGDTVSFIDPDCDEDRIYLVNKSELKKYPQRKFGLYDYDGQELRMRAGTSGYGSDAYTGALGEAVNFGTAEPRAHALIKRAAVTDLATSVAAYA